jgi:hypothetical protein
MAARMGMTTSSSINVKAARFFICRDEEIMLPNLLERLFIGIDKPPNRMDI